MDDIMSSTDKDNDSLVTFDEFVPWYRKMAESHWRMTHDDAAQGAVQGSGFRV
jgi:hypothetical protein